jgi:hypothetical protein
MEEKRMLVFAQVRGFSKGNGEEETLLVSHSIGK